MTNDTDHILVRTKSNLLFLNITREHDY